MNAPAPLPSRAEHDAWALGLLQRQCAMLEQLAEAGLRLAQAVERLAGERQAGEAPAPDAPSKPITAAEAAMAFSRVARAVRMTALLQLKLVQDLSRMRTTATRLGAEDEASLQASARAAEARLDPAYGHKLRVEAIVERVARAGRRDHEAVDRLMAEAVERLDDDDIYGEVLERPVGELVSLLCRDLGLKPDWTRLAEEAWAREEADDPRSPFCSMAPPTTSPAGGGGGPLAEERVVERAREAPTFTSSLIFDDC